VEHGSGTSSKVLPSNAFRELKPGETYVPVVPADKAPPEVTPWSVGLGLLMVLVFTFAAAYIGLMTGNVIEAAIPISILAVFLGNTLLPRIGGRRSTILENVIVQSIGQAAGVVVAGAIFTIPALYINDLHPSFWQVFLSCMLGGFLGVVLLIPLRRYFVRDLHGQLPFPEATAIANVLASGERTKGAGGKILLWSFGIGFLYDLVAEFVHLWNGELGSKVLFGKFGRFLADRRIELNLNATAVYFGLGYIIGPRYAGVIAAGSVLSFLVIIPLVYLVGHGLPVPLVPPETTELIRDMSARQIFTLYVRPIGVGAIAVSGLIGIVKMGKIILSSLSLAFKGFTGGAGETESAERTDLDIGPRNILLIEIGTVLGMFLLFWWVSGNLLTAIIGAAITGLLAFLFTPVAARAIAIVGTNPVSGMTLITLILASVILFRTGLARGQLGQTIALIIGCAVCTALATSGAFVSDLKIGYWFGSTPRAQERWKFLGIVLASFAVGIVIWVIANSYGFVATPEHPNPVPAPQGNLMAAIVGGLMGGKEQPLFLYAMGGLVAILLEMARVPALAFALGMYLPIEINMAVYAGAGFGWWIERTGRDEKEREALRDQGTLIASGLMAGAAIVGTVGAIFLLPQWTKLGLSAPPMKLIDLVHRAGEHGGWNAFYEGFGGQLVGLLAFIGLGFLCWAIARHGARLQAEEEARAGRD